MYLTLPAGADYTQPATTAPHLVEDNHLVTHWRVV